MKVQKGIKHLLKTHTFKINFYGCLLIAILVTHCETDRTTQNADFQNPLANARDGPAAGNPNGTSPVPLAAGLEDVSKPDHIVGKGTPESCTGEAFIDAVSKGGKIVFNCGSEPVTITLSKPAKVFNDASTDIIIDGNGLITLSGGGKTRILYMNTCDQNQHWTTSHCQDQETPRLTVQNITFADGNSRNEGEYEGGGNGGNPSATGTPGGGSGGAIYNDGNTMTLTILGTLIEKNNVNAYGSGIFFVTNDHTGDIRIDNSVIRNNIGGSWYPVYPAISMHSDTKCVVTNSTIE